MGFKLNIIFLYFLYVHYTWPATSLFENGKQNITDQTGAMGNRSNSLWLWRDERSEKCAAIKKNAEERVDMDGAREKIENNLTTNSTTKYRTQHWRDERYVRRRLSSSINMRLEGAMEIPLEVQASTLWESKPDVGYTCHPSACLPSCPALGRNLLQTPA